MMAPAANNVTPPITMIIPPMMFSIAIIVTPVGRDLCMPCHMHIFGFKGNDHGNCWHAVKIEKERGTVAPLVLSKWRRVVGAGVVGGVTALGSWWCIWAACRVSVV